MSTIKDVAKLAGVSVTTVSRALNSPELVEESTRTRILDVVDQLHYERNEFARSLITKRSKTIGVLVPDIANLYFSTLIDGLANGLSVEGYDIFLCITGSNFEQEERNIKNLIGKQVDCIMSVGTRPMNREQDDPLISLTSKMPVILVNEFISGHNFYSVRTDEISGAYLAVKYLIQLGHKKIGFINGNRNYHTNHYKKTGYLMALSAFDIPFNDEYCVNVVPYELGGFEGAEQLLALPDPPTAIFVASDQMALGVYRSLAMRNLSVPDDISVVGFSAMPFSSVMTPPLTTIDQYPYEIGLRSAQMAISILSDSKELDDIDKQVVLQPKVLERDSCKKID